MQRPPSITCSATSAFCVQPVDGWNSHPEWDYPFSQLPASCHAPLHYCLGKSICQSWERTGNHMDLQLAALMVAWVIRACGWGWAAGSAGGGLAASKGCTSKGEAARGRTRMTNATQPSSTAFSSSGSFRQVRCRMSHFVRSHGGARGAEGGQDDGRWQWRHQARSLVSHSEIQVLPWPTLCSVYVGQF